MTQDKTVGRHHQLNRQEFELTLGDGEGQGNLVKCNPWGCKELDVTERVNNNSMTKEARVQNEKNTVSSINGVRETGELHAKESNCAAFLYHTQNNLKMY